MLVHLCLSVLPLVHCIYIAIQARTSISLELSSNKCVLYLESVVRINMCSCFLCVLLVRLCNAPAAVLNQENRPKWWHFCAVTVFSSEGTMCRRVYALVFQNYLCSLMQHCCHLNFVFETASWQLKGISAARSFTHVHRIPMEYGIHIFGPKYFVNYISFLLPLLGVCRSNSWLLL